MSDINENTVNRPNNTEEEEIDLLELAAKLWKSRRTVLKWCAVGAVLGLVIGFSLPKTYSTSTLIAPETEQKTNGNNLSSIAAMAEISLDNSVDAINVNLFPEVVHSVPFIYGLFDLEVTTVNGELTTSLLDYMLNYQKNTWWSYLIGLPWEVLNWIRTLFVEEEIKEGPLHMKNLPKDVRKVVRYFTEKIGVTTDKTTGKTVLTLEMQDPLVVATVLEAIEENLKEYMAEYRTSKARQDVENLSVICSERKADYYKAQQAYAAYSDANKNVVLQSAQAERERLQQEMNLAYQVYSQVANQLEAARIQEQQAKPVFTVIEPVTVPLKKSAPKRAMILIVWTFLFGVGSICWEIIGKHIFMSLKKAVE